MGGRSMKQLKRIICLVLAAGMLRAMLSGCGSK